MVNVKLVGVAAILLLIVGGVMACHYEVEIGHVGVQYDQFRGGVQEKELKEGFNLKLPWVDIEEYDIRSQVYTMTETHGEGNVAGDDAITTLTKEGLSITMDMSVQYRIDPAKASDIHQTKGITYQDKIIRPGIKSVIRDTVAQYEALEVYGEDRTKVAAEMQEALERTIEDEGIIVEKVLIRDVRLPQKIKDSIDAKMQADQDAQRMIFVNEKLTLEAEGRRIKAQGIADAEVIEATGEAEAIRLVKKELASGGDTYVELQYVKMLESQDITTMIVPPGSKPIIGSIT